MLSDFLIYIDKLKEELLNPPPPPPEKYILTPFWYNVAKEHGYDMDQFQRWEPFVLDLSDDAKVIEAGLHSVVSNYLDGLERK